MWMSARLPVFVTSRTYPQRIYIKMHQLHLLPRRWTASRLEVHHHLYCSPWSWKKFISGPAHLTASVFFPLSSLEVAECHWLSMVSGHHITSCWDKALRLLKIFLYLYCLNLLGMLSFGWIALSQMPPVGALLYLLMLKEWIVLFSQWLCKNSQEVFIPVAKQSFTITSCFFFNLNPNK